ncbi:4Fe-4S dicluster domain-containing protein [Pelosinus sp. sgz500959]|uniref:4Fe-4S dicluster domain-containing protein n=1 Tax=Pelosinus sp. sgz500959 TaxID=3242472 RepID=UPI00366CAE89
MAKGVLVDVTKCIGCGSCTVACNLWNGLSYDKEKPAMGSNIKLDAKNWTVVNGHEVTNKNHELVRRFVKEQCFHCQEPACASACFSKALQKDEEGAVTYYPHLCVGCRYCMVACPFDIPKYEWDKSFPLVTKCQMCSTRMTKGEVPACVAVCPTGVMQFGERNTLLLQAKNTLAKDEGYVKSVYGEKEVGGTAWLYISDIPFEELGFKMNLGVTALPTYSHSFLKNIPGMAFVWGMVLTGLYYYTKRRAEIANKKLVKKDRSPKIKKQIDESKLMGEEKDES